MAHHDLRLVTLHIIIHCLAFLNFGKKVCLCFAFCGVFCLWLCVCCLIYCFAGLCLWRHQMMSGTSSSNVAAPAAVISGTSGAGSGTVCWCGVLLCVLLCGLRVCLLCVVCVLCVLCCVLFRLYRHTKKANKQYRFYNPVTYTHTHIHTHTQNARSPPYTPKSGDKYDDMHTAEAALKNWANNNGFTLILQRTSVNRRTLMYVCVCVCV